MMPITDPNFNPSGNKVIDVIKNHALSLELAITTNVPEGRRRSIALTQLEQATMWAVKAAAVGDD